MVLHGRPCGRVGHRRTHIVERPRRYRRGLSHVRASWVMSVRRAAIEDFVLCAGGEPFDLVFAVRVGALDGRLPEADRRALRRVAVVLAPGGRLFVDGGDPLREITP
ncbi:hypothetical protein AB0C84_42410, partial [Actinomadura sp. NPDC048955]